MVEARVCADRLMPSTLVIQSHRKPLPFQWLDRCLDSVKNWAEASGFDYRFIDDELLSFLDQALIDKTRNQVVIATDLARLKWLQQELANGYETVVWCDADFLVFDPKRFMLPDTAFALGREVWIQKDAKGNLRVYSKVHNAFLMFRKGNSFLNFYADTAERLLRLNQGSMPPQYIGPKLLSALHNIANCPVMESAGMLSPLLLRDLLTGEGKALLLFREKSTASLAGANLGSSLCQSENLDENDMQFVIDRLLDGFPI